MRLIGLLALVLGFLVPFLAAAPAHAQATRTWVSGVGDDANPCSRTAPCKTFAGAISKTAAAGEINCLDSAGFGAVTIVKAMTIACEGVIGGVLVSGTNAIVISAGAADVVTLRGLDINGLNTGLVGVKVNSAATVFVENCSIYGFTQWGIQHLPSGATGLNVRNVIIKQNGTNSTTGGIQVSTTASGFARAVVQNVTVDHNSVGISSLGTNNTAAIQVYYSVISNNTGFGLTATGTGSGIKVGFSAILGNGGAATNGNVSSYNNNEISDNGSDTIPPTISLH